MMARKGNPTKTARLTAKTHKSIRSAAVGRKPAATRRSAASKKVSAMSKRAPASQGQKDETRAQLEKLERNNTKLVAQIEEMSAAAKVAAARIAEPEDQVARLQSQLAARPRDTGEKPAASSTTTHRRVHRHEIDPGDSVPPGVAVAEPAPMDLQAENARVNLEKHLRGEQP